MNGRLRSPVVALALAVAACGDQVRGPQAAPPPTAATSPPPGARHVLERTVVALGPDEAGRVAAVLEARLEAVGARAPAVEFGPGGAAAGADPGFPGGVQRLTMAWSGGAGEDEGASSLYGSFLVRSGRLSLRTVLSEEAGSCAGNLNLTAVADPADAQLGDRCLHLAPAFSTEPRVDDAAATAGADPGTWTIRFALHEDEAATLRAVAGERVVVAVDGFNLGEASVRADPPVVATSGPFAGGEVEARSVAAAVARPLPRPDLTFVGPAVE